MAKRTITLTNRQPVTIEEDNWPVIASASDKDWDNQYECQAAYARGVQYQDARVELEREAGKVLNLAV